MQIEKGIYRDQHFLVKVWMDGDEGKEKGKFYVESSFNGFERFSDYGSAIEHFKKLVDKFMENIPQTDNDWYEEIKSCMVWTGYEDCHIDKDMFFILLKKAREHYKEDIS